MNTLNAWCKDRLCKELWTCRCRGCCISRWKGSVNHLCNSYCRQNSKLKSTFADREDDLSRVARVMADGEAAQTAPDTAAAPAPERPSLRGCLANGKWDMGWNAETLIFDERWRKYNEAVRSWSTLLFLSRYSKLQVWHDLTLINSVWISLTLLVNMFCCQGCSTFIRGSQISLMIFWELVGCWEIWGTPSLLYIRIFILFIRSNMFVKLAYFQARSKLTILQAGPEAIAGEAAAKLFLVHDL